MYSDVEVSQDLAAELRAPLPLSRRQCEMAINLADDDSPFPPDSDLAPGLGVLTWGGISLAFWGTVALAVWLA